MVTKVKVSTVVGKQLPAHFASAETELTLLLKKYYEWMESSGGVLDSSQNAYENFYLDSSDADFLKFFTKRVIPNIPQDALIDKKLIAKYARQFYQSKGSEESFKFLFRAIYGKSVDIYYPKVDLFRTSSATWLGQHELKVYTPDPAIATAIGRKLIGQTSGASCIIQSVTPYQGHFDLGVGNPIGVFLIDEPVFVEPIDGGSKIYARTLGQVNVAKVISGGSGYSVGSTLSYTGGDGQDLSAMVSEVDSFGAIVKVTIADGGFGYATTAPTFNGVGGANIVFYLGAMTTLSNFLDDTDFLSSSKKLQDGCYFQDYSYVLKSSVNASTYKLVVDALLHPAGTMQFNELVEDPLNAVHAWFVGVNSVASFFEKVYSYDLSMGNQVPFISSFGGGVELTLLTVPTVSSLLDIIQPYSEIPIAQYADVRIMDIGQDVGMGVKYTTTFVTIA